MFAITGNISSLIKCRARSGGSFYRIMLKKDMKKKDKSHEMQMEFFSFYERVNEKFESNEIALGDNIEFTFYIKGVQRDERTWNNNLMVKQVSLIKKALKKV